MSGRLPRLGVVGGVLLVLLAMPARAENPPAATPDQVARLEALLEAQQKKIDALEQQVAAAAEQDVNKARVEEMKQQIREILSEQEFRESLMPTTVQAGYDKGFYIRSTDEKFMMKINGLFQMRYTYYQTRPENRYLAPGYRRHDRSGFDIQRMRLAFNGYAYSKDLTYYIEMDMSSSNSYNTRLWYAWTNYRVMDEFQIKAGMFRLASTRCTMDSTAAFQLVDYPMMDSVFGLGTGLGVRLWGQAFNKHVEYYLDIVNSLGTPYRQTITNDEDYYTTGHDNNPALVARVTWHALTGATQGTPPPVEGHFFTKSDIEHHIEPALDIGMHYAFKEDDDDGTLRIPFPRKTFYREGGFGLTGSNGLQINQLGWDAAFKWMGFSISGEYVLRILDVTSASHAPFTPLYQLTGDDSTNAQHGGYLQAGYFLPIPGLENKIEAVARVEGVSTLSGGQEGMWAYSGGLNYFIEGTRVKLQTDITKVQEAPISSPSYSLANVNDDALIWRVQFQVAF